MMPLPAGVELEPLLAALKNLSWQAADILLAYARKPMELSVDKGGEGPVTAADLAVNKLLLDGLNSAFPTAPWALLSEETAAEQGSQIIESNEWLWILDPLDGTKDFIQGTGEYAVHLALVHQQRPVLGVVLLPEKQELWFGLLLDENCSAWCENRAGIKQQVQFSKRKELAELVLVASRNHRDQRLEQLLQQLEIGRSLTVGSVGCKVAAILRGDADIYVSLSAKSAPKHWDMAAPEAVLLAAGGGFSHADGKPLTYTSSSFLQAGCLIASHGISHPLLCERATKAMASIDPGFQV
ncbi:3'(2'),5'-bisphosphate nucleotidase CysQ [Synechococcus lacustris]|uniref:3'(2'),5'-bisphosphate nucleotidase CysQ n=1 Tax=Synechococcus lacustris TaxID=2116544 RepID=UPI0020CEDD73|nr:3'(2'),5'-bisphosphate nucleotidase CysQ [Synechococcus lacustris]MCP9922108.1 3'(2'),5'-bisphosphate nucleotidase CysQ [Synechococcus lacustris Cruz CV12-2]